jgi:diacylglycerol kinase (ATP)
MENRMKETKIEQWNNERKSAENKEIAVIYNPSAGGGKALRKKGRVETAFDAYGIPHDLFLTESEAHLVETAAEVVHKYPVIIGGGGDTTINIIATQILRQGTKNKLGIISMGSVNDLAREIGVHKLEDAIDAVKYNRTCPLDVGMITSGNHGRSYYFLVSASLGLGVSVNRYVEDWMRKHPFFSSFRSATQQTAAMKGIRQAFKSKNVPLEVTLESGGEIYAIVSSLLVFSNTSSFAGIFRPSPTASPVSGKLDCCIFEMSSLASVFKVSFDIKRQKHLEKNEVRVISDSTFKIHSKSPLEFQVDGEIIQLDGEIEISVLPKALTMFANSRFS